MICLANASFSRDEAVLALDVLFFSKDQRLSANSTSILELSELLKKLPIHPSENRRADFRTPTGVLHQIQLFKKSLDRGEKHINVGNIFFTVYFEYEDDLESLHKAAGAIRRNISFFSALFGNAGEECGFQEGILLGHLHRLIETQAEKKIKKADRCEICQISPMQVYRLLDDTLELHLIVDPVEMNGNEKYSADKFITVCPNCHAALHRVRPWIPKDRIETILR